VRVKLRGETTLWLTNKEKPDTIHLEQKFLKQRKNPVTPSPAALIIARALTDALNSDERLEQLRGHILSVTGEAIEIEAVAAVLTRHIYDTISGGISVSAELPNTIQR
jgi:hypothetical protein